MNNRPTKGLTYIVNDMNMLVLITEVYPALIGINWIAKGKQLYSGKEVHLDRTQTLCLVPSPSTEKVYLMDGITEVMIDEITLITSGTVGWSGNGTIVLTGESIHISNQNIFEEIV